MNYCENCYNTNKEVECVNCVRNPKNPKLIDRWVGHPICCPLGYKDCVNDPGYLWRYDRDWFISLYGDILYSDDACSCNCGDGSGYDDEDK